MGFGRSVRLFSRRCSLHRRMAGTRWRPAARSRPCIIAVVCDRRRPRSRCRSVHRGGRAMPERARGKRDRLSVSIERRRAFRWLLLPAAQWTMPVAWADASRIASARLWPAQEYTRVIFESSSPIEHQLVVLRDPDRVVLDLARIVPSRELDELPSHVQRSDPYIAAIRIGTPSGGFLRVAIDLKTEVRPQVFALKPIAEFGYRLVVDLYPVTPVDPLLAFLQSEGLDANEPVQPKAQLAPRGQETPKRAPRKSASRRI